MTKIAFASAALACIGIGCSGSGAGKAPVSLGGDGDTGGSGAGSMIGEGDGVTPGVAGRGGGAGGATDPGDGPPACATSSPDVPGVWSEVPPPAGVQNFKATDGFALGPDDLLFAGVPVNPRTGETGDGIVLRRRHGCWTVELLIPSTDQGGVRPSIHGTGPNDVWAVGGGFIYHRDAAGWMLFPDDRWRAMVQRRSFEPVRPSLVRVRAVDADDVWIEERGTILHRSGGEWTAYNFDSPDYPDASASIAFFFSDIWIDGPNDVWFSGGSDVVGNTMDPAFLHHFDGTTFSRFGITRFDVPAIWRSGPSLWLATPGSEIFTDNHAKPATLARFDGAQAMIVDLPPRPGTFQIEISRFWGRTGDDIWGAGNDVAHFDGNAWSVDADTPPAARTDDFEGTFVTGEPNAVWLVAPGPRFFRRPFAAH